MTKTYSNPNLIKHNNDATKAIGYLAPILAKVQAADAAGDFAAAKAGLSLLKLQLSATSRCYRNMLATRVRVARIAEPTKIPIVLAELFVRGGLERHAQFVWVELGFDYRVAKLPDDAGAQQARQLAEKPSCTRAQKALYLAAAAWLAAEVDWARLLPSDRPVAERPLDTDTVPTIPSPAYMKWLRSLGTDDEVGLSDESGPVTVLGPMWGTPFNREGRRHDFAFGSLRFAANGVGVGHSGWVVPVTLAHLEAMAKQSARDAAAQAA